MDESVVPLPGAAFRVPDTCQHCGAPWSTLGHTVRVQKEPPALVFECSLPVADKSPGYLGTLKL